MSAERRAFTAADKNEIWRRWKRGDRITDIAKAMGRETGSIYCHMLAHGGISPRERIRSTRVLGLVEREAISRSLAAGHSIRAIATRLGRSPSTISREIARNGGRDSYRAIAADKRAWEAARRPQACKLARNPQLRRLVVAKLARNWSPEQIAGWLQLHFPGQSDMNVSHEAIYRTLFVQARGALKKELTANLRTRRRFRRSRQAQPSKQGQILEAIPIRDRPPEAEDRAVPGHWEGDLLVGSGSTQIATLVERRSRYTMLVKVPRRDAGTVCQSLASHIRRLPSELAQSLTWDRGTELAQHKELRIAADIAVYFCDPQSPWQRGTNENTNRLLRQYFPKGTRLDKLSQAQLGAVARELNSRPRKTLEYRTPADVFWEALP